MAELIAVVGLAASIASLIDVSTRLIAKLNDICSKCPTMAQMASQLTHQLLLLKTGLQHIQKQAELSKVPPDIMAAVLAVIEDTKAHCECLRQDLHQIVPQSPASRTEQILGALRSFRLEKRCKEAIEKIRQNLNILSFYQQAAHSDDIERIRKLIHQNLISKSAEDVRTMQQKMGLILGTAPVLDPDYFIGREAELADLDRYLSPRVNANAQRIVSIVGIGGVGKTQLSLAYARKYAHQFTSIFWLDAGEVSDVRQSMIRIWNLIEGDQSTHPRTEDEKVESLRSWLAEPWNDGWLLMFDNHDNPKMPGHNSSSAYDLRPLFPSRAHGKILITTRSANLTYTKQLDLKEVESVDVALKLLSQRASRDMTKGTLSNFQIFQSKL
jgi:NB-ARC domain/N-terminal domain on NACHT_NTPase and P-loop NTPases